MKNIKPKPHVLLINQFCGFLCEDLANGLAKEFSTLDLICGNPNKANFINEVKIKKFIAYNRSSLISRFTSWTIFSIQCFFYGLWNKSNVWVLVSNPPFIPLIMGWLANLKKISFFIVVYDLYPESLQQTKFISADSFLFKKWQNLNRLIFKKSKGIITLSTSMKLAIEKYLPNSDFTKVIVIPNWYDSKVNTTFSTPYGENPYQNKWENKLIILYSGNFGFTHDLSSLIEAANLLRINKYIHFVLAGDGAQKNLLIKMANEYKLSNLEFLPYQSSENFSYLLKKSDIGVVSLSSGAESNSIPSKTYTAMALGLCILGISESKSSLEQLIHSYQMGINIPPNNPYLLSQTILELNQNREKLVKYKIASKKASKNFTNRNVENYVSFIRKLA